MKSLYIPNEFRVTARWQSIESPKYIAFVFEVAAKRPGRPTDERRQLGNSGEHPQPTIRRLQRQRVYQQGSCILITVMIFFTLSLLLLTGLHRQLEYAIRITHHEQSYLQAYNQAASSLSWGITRRWPLKSLQYNKSRYYGKWTCETQAFHGLKACIKAAAASNLLWLKGEGTVPNQTQKIVLYQQVAPVIDPSAIELQKVVGIAQRWLDFCPERDEKFCAD
ncbi:YgdB family protein [Candidatus Regiella endosymbiont of Tuberolachnus salignus]|uniref:YgdB family protein n=1 Tax=Candidatus Regiella endosymbiont of Tuberolachnus salignus TaxID=3077956 RepID=UPI0030CFB30B